MSYRIVVHPISPRWKTHWSDGYIMWPISPILSRLDFLYPSFLCFLSFPPALLILVGSLSSCMSSLSIFVHQADATPATNQDSMEYHAGSSLQSLSVFVHFFLLQCSSASFNQSPASKPPHLPAHNQYPTSGPIFYDKVKTTPSTILCLLLCGSATFDMSNQTFQTLPGCFSHHTPSKWIFFPPTLMLSFFLM